MTFDLSRYLEEKRSKINAALSEHTRPASKESRLCEAMRYSLLGNGKRLRPILCIASAEAVGGSFNDGLLLDVACAIEMIHAYSLIHDDLPAMDDDVLRRGRPTCHIRFDEATAILAGDALLTLAFETISAAAAHEPGMAAKLLSISGRIARAAGPRGMIEGQMRDMISENQDIGIESLKEIHMLKTGALIEASVLSGALIAGADEKSLSLLSTYARNLGLAFQVTDDVLNIEGDPEIMGKSAQTDAMRHKSAYPALIGLEESKKYAERLVEDAVASLAGFGPGARPLEEIAKYVLLRKK